MLFSRVWWRLVGENLVGSVLVCGVLLATVGWWWQERHEKLAQIGRSAPAQEVVEAVTNVQVVDSQTLAQTIAKIEQRKKAEEEARLAAERAKREAEERERRLAQQKKEAEERARKLAQEKKAAEERAQKAAEAKKAQEKKAAEEKAKQVAKEKQLTEKKAADKKKQEKKAAEAKKAQEKKAAEEKAKQVAKEKQLAEKKAADKKKQAQKAAEAKKAQERQARLAQEKAKQQAIEAFRSSVENKIRQSRRLVPHMPRDLKVVLLVRLNHKGEVVSVEILKSSGYLIVDHTAQDDIYKQERFELPTNPLARAEILRDGIQINYD